MVDRSKLEDQQLKNLSPNHVMSEERSLRQSDSDNQAAVVGEVGGCLAGQCLKNN